MIGNEKRNAVIKASYTHRHTGRDQIKQHNYYDFRSDEQCLIGKRMR